MTHQKKQVRISDIVIPKYLPVFNDRKYRHIILTSGRAGTKSSFVAIRANYQIIADSYGSVVVLRKHHNKLRKTVYKEMLRGIGRLQIPKNRFRITKSPMEISYRKNGSTIYFSGSDGIDDTKGIIDEDKPIKLVILDELTEFFEDGEGEDELQNIEATFIRGNSSGFQMIYLFNPPKNPNAPIMEWLKKMEERPDCIHIHTDYRDVPEEWLGRDLIETAETMMRLDKKQYSWVWLGECIGVDELIYYMFSGRHKGRPEEGQKYNLIGIGADYGQQNATTYQACGINEYQCRLDGLQEYYHSGRETGKQKSPSEYAADFADFVESMQEAYGCNIFYLYLDPSARGLQEEIKRTCRQRGLAIHFKDAQNEVALGIARVQKLLTYGILRISPEQKHLIEEFGLYEYDRKLLEKGRETETLEHIQNIGPGCKVSRKYESEGGIESLLENFNAEDLFSHIEGNPDDVIDTPNETKDYKITIDYKKSPQRVIEGNYDKNGLPEDFADFAETVFEFIRFYGLGEVLDPSVYGKAKRRKSEYIFCSVTFDEGYKSYYYLTDDDSIEVGDFVLVPAGKDNHEAVVEVVNIEYFSEENVPLPIEKTKRIIRKCTDEDFELPD